MYSSFLYNTAERKVKIISCNINKKELDIILPVMLQECNVDVFGYDQYKQEYWGKIYQKQFSFLLTTENDQISVYPEMDSRTFMPNFCKQLSRCVAFYQNQALR